MDYTKPVEELKTEFTGLTSAQQWDELMILFKSAKNGNALHHDIFLELYYLHIGKKYITEKRV